MRFLFIICLVIFFVNFAWAQNPDQETILNTIKLRYKELSLQGTAKHSETLQTDPRSAPLRIAFVYVGPINDLGWTFAHNEGRVLIEKHYDGHVITFAFPSVPDYFDNPNACTKFFSELMNEPWDLIIGTSYSFQYPMYALTSLYPQTYFLHISGDITPEVNIHNWALGFAKIHHARYLTGYLAGLVTQVNRIGHVAAVRIPESYYGINAFFFGARDANALVGMSNTWTNEWVRPDVEVYQAHYLMDRDRIDIFARHTDSLETSFLAAEHGMFSIGYNVDASRFVSNFVLSSAIWDWSPLYIHFIDKIINGSWAFESLWAPFSDQIARVTPASNIVSDEIRALFAAKVAEFQSDPDIEVFCGRWAAWYDPSIPANASSQCLTNAQILGMTSLHPEINDLGYIGIPLTRVDVTESMLIAAQTLAGIGLFACLVILCCFLVWQNKNVLRYASPFYSGITITGACMMLVSVFVLSPQPPTQGECIAFYWLLCIGFGTFYAGILVKTWRIVMVIRGATAFKAVFIPVSRLLAMLSVIVGIEILLLILYTVIDVPHVSKLTSADDSSLGPYEYREVCHYPGASSILLWILVAYNGFILCAGVILTFYTRDIAKIFNESKHLALGIYSFGFALAVIVPIIEITNDINAEYLVTCLGIIFSTITAVLALYLPKMYVILSGQDAEYTFESLKGSMMKSAPPQGTFLTAGSSELSSSSFKRD